MLVCFALFRLGVSAVADAAGSGNSPNGALRRIALLARLPTAQPVPHVFFNVLCSSIWGDPSHPGPIWAENPPLMIVLVVFWACFPRMKKSLAADHWIASRWWKKAMLFLTAPLLGGKPAGAAVGLRSCPTDGPVRRSASRVSGWLCRVLPESGAGTLRRTRGDRVTAPPTRCRRSGWLDATDATAWRLAVCAERGGYSPSVDLRRRM